VAKRNRTIGSVKAELVTKSREAALSAIRTFNDPQVQFKCEMFVVLMVISWTYLLHAHFRSKQGIEHRYFEAVGRRASSFEPDVEGRVQVLGAGALPRTSKPSPVRQRRPRTTCAFLIGLRHEIEHQMTRSLDAWLGGRYQACAMNFNVYIKKLFGERCGLDRHLALCIQFIELTEEQLAGKRPEASIPPRLRAYIAEFDGKLTHDEYNSERFSYRLWFKKKLVNRPGQADKIVEFIDPDSEAAKAIDKEQWVKKEVEREKFRATEVIAEAHKAGFAKLNPSSHATMWKTEEAKKPGKGYGIDVRGYWYWYRSWVDRVLELCAAAGDKYK
jgi:hypothetical protein